MTFTEKYKYWNLEILAKDPTPVDRNGINCQHFDASKNMLHMMLNRIKKSCCTKNSKKSLKKSLSPCRTINRVTIIQFKEKYSNILWDILNYIRHMSNAED